MRGGLLLIRGLVLAEPRTELTLTLTLTMLARASLRPHRSRRIRRGATCSFHPHHSPAGVDALSELTKFPSLPLHFSTPPLIPPLTHSNPSKLHSLDLSWIALDRQDEPHRTNKGSSIRPLDQDMMLFSETAMQMRHRPEPDSALMRSNVI